MATTEEMSSVQKWFKVMLEDFKNDPEFQAEVIALLNEQDPEPVLRNEYDGD